MQLADALLDMNHSTARTIKVTNLPGGVTVLIEVRAGAADLTVKVYETDPVKRAGALSVPMPEVRP